ncbi:anaerobic ribonucleoside-triphosphate reductase [Brachyspira catarrhinii]|uniref:Anaerobic ribonucleoside-triphosphate reductase n=1 Tax=Brachyspira catarrhinii TaxID=2528966 RepID=A0ABY2TQR1_9SPIR|nr:anaerobic ribonucleoside-triphosphate reductase [Brachyspira catarrhinii]TKZ35155.1 anaerobic ribonucleoside-triphosphate reductase [Brachyspira catarrhinii]
MTKFSNENAAERYSYIGHIYRKSERMQKEECLNLLSKELSDLHRNGYIHIHDLDAYGLTYNCLAFNIDNCFPYHEYEGLSDYRKILKLFNFYRELFVKIGNEQSGGEAFANFDIDTAKILTNLGVENSKDNLSLIKECISEFIYWCNNCHDRMGMVNYYITLNIGLANDEYSYQICEITIDAFSEMPSDVFKPNIVFKVKSGVNLEKDSPNYNLFIKSLMCTSKKMIPTYLLCDSKPNKGIDPKLLSVMGCRTRIVDNIFGKEGSIGRGNIANISVNLPRLALEIVNDNNIIDEDSKFEALKSKWLTIAEQVTEILLDRYNRLNKLDSSFFPTNSKYNLWIENFDIDKNVENIFRHGTLSIGFIGLSETIEIITGNKFYLNDKAMDMAYNFVKFMREYTDKCIKKYNLNFSLLATSGELISGRFCDIDSKLYEHNVLKKGFYTNSFHVDVDSLISGFDKIDKEAPFHLLSNGGCITYIELGEVPIGNHMALEEYINYALNAGIHYLGFNFPLDICNMCGSRGIFDKCDECGSDDIKKIRRVSGYLEILDQFTNGKYLEAKKRDVNYYDNSHRRS